MINNYIAGGFRSRQPGDGSAISVRPSRRHATRAPAGRLPAAGMSAGTTPPPARRSAPSHAAAVARNRLISLSKLSRREATPHRTAPAGRPRRFPSAERRGPSPRMPVPAPHPQPAEAVFRQRRDAAAARGSAISDQPKPAPRHASPAGSPLSAGTPTGAPNLADRLPHPPAPLPRPATGSFRWPSLGAGQLPAPLTKLPRRRDARGVLPQYRYSRASFGNA